MSKELKRLQRVGRLVSNKPPKAPSVVIDSIKHFLIEDENFNIFDSRAKVGGHLYYYVTFFNTREAPGVDHTGKLIKGYLIVRDDGTVPSKKEAREPLILINTTDSIFRQFLLMNLRDLAEEPVKPWERLRNNLIKIESIYNEKMDKQAREGLDAFKKTVDVIITNQTKMIDMVKCAEDMLKQHTVEYIVTKEFNDKLHHMFDQFMNYVAEKHEVQIQTQEVREQLLHFLKSNIPFWKLKWRFMYQRLKLAHRKIYANKSDIEAHHDLKNDITRKKETIKVINDIYNKLRNP